LRESQYGIITKLKLREVTFMMAGLRCEYDEKEL
jgi:hypothetical protein